jgi:hypothetical protein
LPWLRSRSLSVFQPSSKEGVIKSFDQPLLLTLIERRRLQKILKLLQSSAVVTEALLPADIICNATKLVAREAQERGLT